MKVLFFLFLMMDLEAAEKLKVNSKKSKSGQETALEYTWHDGEKEQKVFLQKHLVAHFGEGTAQGNRAATKVFKEFSGVKILEVPPGFFDQNVLKAKSGGPAYSPVFTTIPNGVLLMALPGGVLVYLDQEMDEAEVRDWAKRKKLNLQFRQSLPGKNAWMLSTAPGLSGLQLANRLRKLQEVKAAIPNWWVPLFPK